MKKLLRGRASKNVSRETLQDNAALYSGWKKLKDKLTTGGTRKKQQLFVKNISLKNEPKGQKRLHPSDRSVNKMPLPFFTNHTQEQIANARFPKVSWIKHPASEPTGDFDEIVTEEGTASRNAIHDEALLEKLMKNADHSDLDENEDEPPRHRSTLGNDSQTQAGYKGDSAIKGRIANGRDRPDEEQNKNKQVSNNTKLSQKEHGDDDDDEKDEDEEGEKEDGRNANQVINDEEQQLLHLMNEKFQDKNQKIKPVAISDQMNQALQALMPSFQERQGQIEASISERERQLEAMREFQTKQAMLQQLQLSYAGNAGAQNTAQVPQYLGPQLWRTPEAPLRAPLVLGPPAPIYQPAYLGPSPNASPLPERNSQGYTINVDGLKGVFSKGPGFAVRFNSPDSEVTVVKKKHDIAVPMSSDH